MTSEADTHLVVVLGHAASGKSAWAEAEVLRRAGRATYVATAQAFGDEMRAKIDAHAARRGPAWTTVEAPLDPAAAVAAAPGAVLLDCLTLWLTNLVLAERDWDASLDTLLAACAAARGPVWVVSNDVGGGVTPDTALGRRFQRVQGAANQRLAAAADRVVWVTAGLPSVLK